MHPAGIGPADSPTPYTSAFTPAGISQAYGVNLVNGDGTGETIAIVDAYDDPMLVSSSDPNFGNSDLHHFDSQYGLPEPTGFFTKVNQIGGTSYPSTDPAGLGWNWEAEEALDVEWVHALAPGAHIFLVEATNDSDYNLYNAVAWAGGHSGALVVTMSWGETEFSGEAANDSYFVQPAGHGVTYLASVGDGPGPTEYPAFSPDVVSVSGTALFVSSNGDYSSESPARGGGISAYELQPAYQAAITQYAPYRTAPDVAFDSDPTNGGVSVYDSYNGTSGGWWQEGGTSLSCQCWGALIAIADQLRANAGLGSLKGPIQTLSALYSQPPDDFHPLKASYGEEPGYNLITGNGSPVANKLLPDLASLGTDNHGPLPTPLIGDAPSGSLIYDTGITHGFLSPGDINDFSIAADPGQTLTVLVKAVSPDLEPSVQVSDPSGVAVGSASASMPGQNALLQTVRTTTGGTYTITVSSQASTYGVYQLQVYLDAALDTESEGVGNINIMATAQDLTSAFVPLQRSSSLASRAAVIGTSGEPVTLKAIAIGIWTASTINPANTGSHTAGSKFFSIGQSTDSHSTGVVVNRAYFVFDLSSVAAQIASASFDIWGSGGSPLPSDTFSLFDVSTPIGILEASGSNQAAIFDDLGSGTSYGSSTLVPNAPPAIVSTLLNAAGIAALNNARGGQIAIGGAITSATGPITDSYFYGTYYNTKDLVLTLQDNRYYSFTMTAGEEATISLKELSGSGKNIAIEDGSGNVLATGGPGAFVDAQIANYIAPASGTYYIVVNGNTPSTYSLVVTRDAAWDTETNVAFGAAQDISSTGAVLGALSSGSEHWYKTQLGPAQDSLQVQTSTPLGGPSQKINVLNPSIQLYDQSDSLIATGTLQTDGRNQMLQAAGLTPGATYYIRVMPADTSTGEYFVSVKPGPAITTITLPNWTVNVPGYSQKVPFVATGTPTFSATGTLPPGLVLSSAGLLSGTPTTAGTYNFTVTVTDSLGFSGSQGFTVVINPVVAITTSTLLNGTVGAAYSQTITISGGTGPFTFSETGALPAGVILATTGILSGTPTVTGTYTFTITATDALGVSDSRAYTVFVFAINPPVLPDWTVNGSGYKQTLTASGGAGPYTFTTTSGNLPTGLTLNPNGLLSGTPTATGTFSFTFAATDSKSNSAYENYTVTVNPPVTITTTTLPSGVQTIAYFETVRALGGTGAVTFTSGGGLPPGLTLSGMGVLAGTPTTIGTFTFTVSATDTTGASGVQSYTVTISPLPITLMPNTIMDWTVKQPGYNQTFTASGGVPPFIFSSPDALPAGLTLTSAGVLSGTPLTGGVMSFNLVATDSIGDTGIKGYGLVINARPTFTTTTLPNWTVDYSYDQTIVTTGGTGNISFGVVAGSLPPGLTLASTGVLFGTPASSGSFSFTVTATDIAGASTNQAYSIYMSPNIAFVTTSLPNWTANQPGYNETLAVAGGTGSVVFTTIGGALPDGLTLSTAGVLAGTPIAAGTFTFTVAVSDNVGAGTSQFFTVIIAPKVTITTTTLPNWTVNQPGYSQTISTSGGTGSLVFSVSGVLPTGLTVSSGGVLSGTPTAIGSFSFIIFSTDSVGATGGRGYTVTINPPVTLAPSTLPASTSGLLYHSTVIASGGTGVVTLTVTNVSGAISGLVVPVTGTEMLDLTGSPTASGTETFTVTATDTVGASVSQNYTVTINPAVSITTASLPTWTVGAAYNQTINASGGTAPLSLGTVTASLPPGITLSSNGVLSGTPTAAGSFTFSVTATDAVGASVSRSLTVLIHPAVSITTTTLASWTVNIGGYTQLIEAIGGTGTYTFSSTGTLPTGLTLSSAGILSGTPTVAGSYLFMVTAVDAVGGTAGQSYSVTINPPLMLTPGVLPSGLVGIAYNQTVTTSGGTGTVMFTLTNVMNAIPGLNISTSSGTGPISITGTPTATGTETFTISAGDAVGSSTSVNYTIKVNPATVYLNLPTSGFSGSPGGMVASFPININELQDQTSTNHVGLSAANLAVSFPMGYFDFPVGLNNASADVSLGSVPLSDTVSPGGAADWTLSATSSADGQLNITLTAKSGKGIPNDNPSSGGSVVMINFPISATYNPPSPTAVPITIVSANGSFHTSITGINGGYGLKPTPPYAGSVTINPSAGAFSQYLVSVVGSSTVQAGNGFLVAVQAADSSGNPVTSYTGPSTVSVSISPASAGSSLPASVNIDSNGLGYILATVQKMGSYMIGVTGGSYSGISNSVTVTPGPPVKLAFAATPTATPTGDVLPPVSVQVEDLYGNILTSDNGDTVIIAVGSGPPGAPGFTSGSTLSASVHNGIATFNNLALVTPGTYKLGAVVPGLYTGPYANPFAVLPLQVVPGSFVGTPSGFSLQFNAPFLVNSTTPVLYGQSTSTIPSPPPSIIVTTDPGNLSDTAAYVIGSLVFNPATNTLTFLATNTTLEGNNGSPLLPDGTYTVIVRSSASTDGFQALNSGGGFLDGLGTGVAGSGDFMATFTVNAAAMKDDVLWVPSTADGPGQVLNAPGKNKTGGGYPIYLNDNTGAVTQVQLTLDYDATLLTVTGVTGAGFSLLSSSTPGQAVLQYSGPALPAGSQIPIGFITATVPSGTSAKPMPYRAEDLLHLVNVSLNGGNIPVTTSDGLHLVAYVGDANGDGAYSGDDALRITRVVLQTDSGFAAYPRVDPVIVADTDGSNFIPSDAALQVNEAGVGVPTMNLPVPPIPSGVVFQTAAFAARHALAVADANPQTSTTDYTDFTDEMQKSNSGPRVRIVPARRGGLEGSATVWIPAARPTGLAAIIPSSVQVAPSVGVGTPPSTLPGSWRSWPQLAEQVFQSVGRATPVDTDLLPAALSSDPLNGVLAWRWGVQSLRKT